MGRHTPEEKQQFAERICDFVREWVVERESEVEFELQRGAEWCTDALTGERVPRPSPTFTLTLKIHGGARVSEGPPIVTRPAVFRAPES